MFFGSAVVSMDAKGRFTLPSNLREQLPAEANSQLIITSDPAQDCLLIYPKESWQEIAEGLSARSDTDAHRKYFKQIFLGNSQEVDIDSNGRLVVPPYLRQVVDLERKLFMRGNGGKIELWSLSVHEAKEAERVTLLRAPEAGESLQGIRY